MHFTALAEQHEVPGGEQIGQENECDPGWWCLFEVIREEANTDSPDQQRESIVGSAENSRCSGENQHLPTPIRFTAHTVHKIVKWAALERDFFMLDNSEFVLATYKKVRN